MLEAAFLIVLKVTLVLAIGLIGARALRRGPAGARHGVLAAAIIGAVLVPALALTLPEWRAPIPWLHRDRVAGAPPGQPGPPAPNPEAQGSGPSVVVTPLRPVMADKPPGRAATAVLAVFAVWATGTAVVLAMLLVGLAEVRRVRRRARPQNEPAWRRMAAGAARDIGVGRAVSLLWSTELTIPLTAGIVRPAIFLPQDSAAWDGERRRVVLLHEMAHVKRHDSAMEIVAWIACAVYWFHPAVWYAARRLRLERELACDAVVAGLTGDPAQYAGHLVEIAAAAGDRSCRAQAALAMTSPGSLEVRVRALLRPERLRSGGSSPKSRAVLATSAAVLAGALAAARPVPLNSRPGGLTQAGRADTVEMRLAPDSTARWRGALDAGDTLTVRGAMGSIVVDSSVDGAVEVGATRRAGPRGAGTDTRVNVIRSGRTLAICSAYFPSGGRVAPCPISDDWGRGSVDDNAVTFRVAVPPGVHVQLMTGLGDLRAERIHGDVKAITGNGNAAIENEGAADVEALTGRIRMHVLGGIRSGPVTLRVLHGGIDVSLPRDAAATVVASTGHGAVTATGNGWTTKAEPGRFVGELNAGGRPIRATIEKGDIRIGARPE